MSPAQQAPGPHDVLAPAYDSTGRLMAAVARHKLSAEYVAGIGWMYVTASGRHGNFDTEWAALNAGRASIAGAHSK